MVCGEASAAVTLSRKAVKKPVTYRLSGAESSALSGYAARFLPRSDPFHRHFARLRPESQRMMHIMPNHCAVGQEGEQGGKQRDASWKR